MIRQNACVGIRFLLLEVFEGTPAVVAYKSFVSTLPLRSLGRELIWAVKTYTRASLLGCEVEFISPTKQDNQKIEVNEYYVHH